MHNGRQPWEDKLSGLHVQDGGFRAALRKRIEARSRFAASPRRRIQLGSFAAALLMVAVLGLVTRLATGSIASKTSAEGMPISFLSTNTLEMFDSQTGWAVGQNGTQLIRTSDGGRTWRDVAPPGTLGAGRAISAAYFGDKNSGWVCVSDLVDNGAPSTPLTLCRTTDGGLHWESAQLPLSPTTSPYGFDLQVMDDNHAWLLVSSESGTPIHGLTTLYRTGDGGRSWEPVADTDWRTGKPDGHGLSTTSNPRWIAFQSPTRGLLEVYGSDSLPASPLYITQDGGSHWDPVDIPASVHVADGRIQAGGAEYHFNGGFAPVMFDAQNGMVGLNYYGPTTGYLNVIYVTHDGGVHWESGTPLTYGFHQIQAGQSGGDFNLLSATRAKLLVGNTLYQTEDAGKTWSGHLLPAGLVQTDFVNEVTGYGIDHDGHLYQTSDGGNHWSLVSARLIGGQ